MAKANAQIEISVGASRLASGLSSAARQFGGFAAGVGRQMGRALSKLKLGDVAKSTAGNLGADIIGRGIDAVATAAGEVRDYESQMQRLGQTTHQSDAQMLSLERSMRATSLATGVNRNALAGAASAYFDATSDVEGMSDALEVFARTSQASGADMEDLVKTSAAMKDSMGLASTEFESAFSGLIAQGEAGKVTLSELAREAPALMAAYSKFGKGTGRQGLMEMNAAFQVGAKAFGTSAEAATGLKAMLGMLDARQKQLAASGVKVYEVNKQGVAVLRPVSAIIDDIARKKIDKRKWGAIFGENREGRAFLSMLMQYPDLYKQIIEAGQRTDVVQEYAQNRAESRAGRLDLAMNRMKQAVADAFTPERIEAFTNSVEQLAEKIGPVADAVGFMADELGGISDVGKAVRGLFDDANPFGAELYQERMKRGYGSELGVKRDKSAKEVELERQSAAWQSTVARIMSKERGEKTTKESLREAYIVARQASGGTGEALAAQSYLMNAKADTKAIRDEWTAEITKALEKGLARQAEILATMKTPTIAIGDNQVATAKERSTKARRRTH